MASIDEILKKLNKSRKEEDAVGFLGNKELKRTVTSSGSPYLDYLTNGTYLNGGYNTLVGDGGAGKSSLALLACADVQKKGRIAVYYDGEGTLNDSYIERMGVNREKLVVLGGQSDGDGRNLEAMLDKVELFATTKDVGIIVIDSIPIFTSTVIEEKSAEENSMTVEARRFAARMPIIEGNAMKNDICILGLTSYREKPGGYGDPRYLSRGNWQKTMSNTILDITRREFIFDENKEAIGHKLDIRIKKIKNGAYDPKEAHSLNFYYDGGFNAVDEYLSMFEVRGLVTKGGAWYSFPDSDGVEHRAQGKEKAIEYLKDNPEIFDFLLKEFNNEQ